MKYTFVIFSEYAELLDLAMQLKFVEGHDVLLHIPDKESSKIGDGIIDKKREWWECIGKNYVWIFDGCSHGKLQDWLRDKGEMVFGGSEQGDELENNRQLGQKLFRAAGFKQPESQNFKDIDQAIKFVNDNTAEDENGKRWILKQNSDAPKSINKKSHFSNNADLIHHLEQLRSKWNESEFGKFDCDIMEQVIGLEVAASVFFNGKDFMRNADGKIVGWLNFEEKMESDRGFGEVVGEMGTTFIGVTEDTPLFKEIILRPKIKEALIASKFRGITDINCIRTREDNELVALELTMRPGIPSTSYALIAGLDNCGEVIKMVANGEDEAINIKMGLGMVVCVVAKPFPVESDVSSEATSLGERLWLLNGKSNYQQISSHDELSDEQRKRIHLYNFDKSKDGYYQVATKNGYLLTVTGVSNEDGTIAELREEILDYIKHNIYINGMKYRTDIGERVETDSATNKERRLQEKHEKEIVELKEIHEKELLTIKNEIREILYNDNK